MTRPFGVADIPAAREFWARVPGLGLSSADEPEALARFLGRNPGLSHAAFVGPELVGTVLAGHDGRRGFLYHLAVEAAHRGRGLATALVETALHGLRQEGIAKVHVFVLGDNGAGLAYWDHAARRGWKRRGDLLVYSRDV